MKTLETVTEFNDLINDGKTIALFTAGWCPDCRVIEPELPEIEQAYPEYTFVSVDRDQFIEVCQDYDVFGIPSFIAFHDGEETGRFVSKDRKTKAEITAFIDELPK